ncbi:MAG: iron ABC transporter substrate-binding protein [Solirubrobacterales bacterium]
MRRLTIALLTLLACLPIAACGGSDADLTVYSGRNETLVGPLFEEFEDETGLDVDVRYGDSAELAATIAEEGANSPADAFFAQDAGSLGAIEDQLAKLPTATLDRVPEQYRDPQGRWVGTSARARVVAYSTERLSEDDLPDTVFDYTGDAWRGRLGLPPTNASFQAFVSVMRLQAGDERARQWLADVKGLDAKLYENNIQTIEAIDRGEIDAGFVNHYYLEELKRENPDLKVANHFLADGDPGTFVNAAGVGVLKTAKNADAAQRFARFLVDRRAQEYFAQHTFEYPLAAGVEPVGELPPLEEVVGPDVALAALGAELEPTLRMLDEVGLTS